MFTNDSTIISQIYDKILINEISTKFVKEIKDAVQSRTLPFNNIFNDKLRIIIPMEGLESYDEILDKIKQIKDYTGFDKDKKEVIREIPIDPKYGGGVKTQRVKLGKAIQSLKIDAENKKKMLNWFAKYESNIPELDKLNDYRIILSRSPIDILRMSDGDWGFSPGTERRSCHAQGGMYFNCAIQEAKTGGMIAFLVRKEELENVSEDEFQNEEIFEDPDRNISGITALARLRIRRYTRIEDVSDSIGIPEVKVYGKDMAGFYSSVRQFLHDKQFSDSEVVDQLSKEFNEREWMLTGGSYTDSSDSTLFNRMFDTTTFRGSAPHDDSEDDSENVIENRANQMDTELREFDERYSFEHFRANYGEIDINDEYVSYNPNGGVTINLSEMGLELTDDFVENCEFDGDDLKRVKRYDPNQSDTLPWSFKNKENFARRFSKFLRDFEAYDPTDFVEEDLSEMRVNKWRDEDKNEVDMGVCFGYDCNYSSDDADEYLNYLEKIEKYDDEFEGIKMAFIKALKKNGFIKSVRMEDIKDELTLSEELEHFEFDQGDNEFYLSEHLATGVNKEKVFVGEMGYNIFATSGNLMKTEYAKFIQNYINDVYKPNINKGEQLTFSKFFESYQNKKTLKQLGLEVSGLISVEEEWSSDNVSINMMLYLKYNDVIGEELYDIIKILDDSYQTLINAGRYLAFYKIMKLNNSYTVNLHRVFGKYFT
jgi:hypothetical protein